MIPAVGSGYTTTGSGRIHVDFRKWPDRPHWHFDAARLGADDFGLWMSVAAGTVLQRGTEPARPAPHDFVMLVPDNRWWTAFWNREGRFEVYVDIATPAVWDGSTVTMIDLDLDVVRLRDGTTAVLDEDEFVEHSTRLEYPERLVDAARTTTAGLVLAVERRHEPFDTVGAEWLGRTG